MIFYKINQILKDFPIKQSIADRSYDKTQFIPKEIAQAVWGQYDKDGFGSQSLDRIEEIGGFGWYEITYYLYSKILELEKKNNHERTN